MASEKSSLDMLWPRLQREAAAQKKQEPLLAGFLHASILGHAKFSDALGYVLANKLAAPDLGALELWGLFTQAYKSDRNLIRYALLDLAAILDRDPAARTAALAFLYLKGFHGLQAYRVAHYLWHQKREALAYHLQNRVAEVISVDIHPAAKIGHGVMLDHATGIVIGETTVVGNNVSMLHGVTLGGTGKQSGDRHPKIGDCVLLGTGCHVLGNIKIGKGAKVAAGSVVLENVPAHTTVAGVPAKIIGKAVGVPGKDMNQCLTVKK
ncbi:MAG: serine O-acetyltransferase [Alphaproteobacteria bacterium]